MGILQARILEWVAILSPPGNHPNSGIEPRSPALQADSLLSKPPGKPINFNTPGFNIQDQLMLTEK